MKNRNEEEEKTQTPRTQRERGRRMRTTQYSQPLLNACAMHNVIAAHMHRPTWLEMKTSISERVHYAHSTKVQRPPFRITFITRRLHLRCRFSFASFSFVARMCVCVRVIAVCTVHINR